MTKLRIHFLLLQEVIVGYDTETHSRRHFDK